MANQKAHSLTIFYRVNWAHLYRGDSLNDWQVSEVFVSVDPSQCDSMRERFDLDPRYPHMQAWLHDTIPVANDMSLTVAELSTVLTLALIVISRPVYRRALTMPVSSLFFLVVATCFIFKLFVLIC